jgi:hypothetical protein
MCVDTRHTKTGRLNIVDAFLITIGCVMLDAEDVVEGADEKALNNALA